MTFQDAQTAANAAAAALEHLKVAWAYYMPEDRGVTETEAETAEYYEYLEAA